MRLGRVAGHDLATRLDDLSAKQSAIDLLPGMATRLDSLAAMTTRIDNSLCAIPSRSSTINRSSIAAHFLRGRGLEIGALHRPLELPAGATAHYLDAAPIETLRARFPEVTDIRTPDVVDDGEHLSTVPDNQYDFIIANHFLEHTENPFATLGNFVRVLRPGGRIFMAIPDKRWTFDKDRPVTTLDHLLEDYRAGPQVSRRQHYDEWLRTIDGFAGDALLERTDAFIRDKVNIHFHVWTFKEMSEMFSAAKGIIGLPLEVKLAFADPPMLEVVWVLEAMMS
jgi:SAM-dependent methyltransferase